jgi:protein-S-isoprenylcysteine O-methyltransferase Ste14
MIYVLFLNVIPYLRYQSRKFDPDYIERISHTELNLSKSQKKLGNFVNFIFFTPIIYSVFLPLKLDTVWLSIGLIIYIMGVSISTMAIYDFLTSPKDIPVTTGIYRFSRHPIYLGLVLVFIGTSIACLSWVFSVFTIVYIFLTHILVISEEQFCLKNYGESYNEYLKRTPRWFGVPK